jgi:hypothetical protein
MDTTIKKYTNLAYALRRVGIGVTFLAFAVAARADLVANGGFETNGGNGQITFNTTATGWSVPDGGYTFLFASGTGDTTGAVGQYGPLSLWGPNNGSANGLPASSPAGGYYIGQDADFQAGAISQTISGLTSGHSYTVGFYWAGIQQSGFDGPTAENWQVSLGSGPSQTTTTWNDPSHGFSGWMHQDFTFTADGTTDVLSFMAGGTPAGPPPFALLDGVTLNPTPEPALYVPGLALMGVLVGLGIRRSKKSVKI